MLVYNSWKETRDSLPPASRSVEVYSVQVFPALDHVILFSQIFPILLKTRNDTRCKTINDFPSLEAAFISARNELDMYIRKYMQACSHNGVTS